MYAVKEGTTNSIDNMKTFDALYLQPNDEGGRHFVYNIDTMQVSSACIVIGTNKKFISMTDLMIYFINKQAREEQEGLEFTDINNNTTVNDFEENGSDSDSNFEDNDKSYETSDDLILDRDHELTNDPNYQEEYLYQHFNVPILKVNDIKKEDIYS